MKSSWRIGRIAGIDVHVHYTFLILLGRVSLSHYLQRQNWPGHFEYRYAVDGQRQDESNVGEFSEQLVWRIKLRRRSKAGDGSEHGLNQ